MKFLTIFSLLFCASVASAQVSANGCQGAGTCFYVDNSATGCGGGGCADTNNGTSKATAWAHAPGMACATNNPAGHTFVQTDEFILRGGDDWPFSCFPW